jgi:hypothetical protein
MNLRSLRKSGRARVPFSYPYPYRFDRFDLPTFTDSSVSKSEHDFALVFGFQELELEGVGLRPYPGA